MDKYKTISTLGAGAAGEALLVLEKSSGQEFVMKKIPTLGMNKEERERVKKEANTLQMLNHPNIVRFKESFFDSDKKNINNTMQRRNVPPPPPTITTPGGGSGEEHFCIVMERCVCSLEDLIDRCHALPENTGGFPQSLLVEWMTELLAALSFLQQKGIIHRDIKSSNIFVTKKNHLKIGDFGVAKHIGGGNSNSKNDNDTSSVTQSSTNSVAFSAFYMSPEICDGATSTLDHKGDVWSLGILFYELCMLHPPFQGGNILAIVNEITTRSVPHLPSSYDSRFNKIIRWMLKKDPAQRPTAQDVLNRYVFLPPSHPSHPQHDPDRGRTIQERHGPPLVLDAGIGGKGGGGSSSSGGDKNTTGDDKNTNSNNANAVAKQKGNDGSSASSSSSPSGRIDGNKQLSEVIQQNHNLVQKQREEKLQQRRDSSNSGANNNNDGERPPASVLDEDEDEDETDDGQDNQITSASASASENIDEAFNPPSSTSNVAGLDQNHDNNNKNASSNNDNPNNNKTKKIAAPSSQHPLPQAFLDEDDQTNTTTTTATASAASSTVNSRNGTVRAPLQVVDENNTTTNNNASSSSSTMASSSNNKNSINNGSSLAQKIAELLETRRGSLSSSELDEAVCVISDFRTKMKL